MGMAESRSEGTPGERGSDRRTGDLPAPLPDAAVVGRLYRSMRLIRETEERTRREYANRNIRGPIHLSIGQEGVAAGILDAARPGDVCVSTHRNHAHYLAKGGSLAGMVDELYGLETGCSAGAGGSMHLYDDGVGMWGSSAIVGGSVPIAVGLALGKRLSGSDDLAIGFTGDGGTDEGAFYEALNLAAQLELAVLFVVEQNELSTNTLMADRQASRDILAKSRAFGVPAAGVDGNDVVAVRALAARTMAEVRRDGRPQLIEARTSRLCAHVGPSISVDSPKGPYPDWAARVAGEPLQVLRRRVAEERPALAPELDAIDREVLAAVDGAFEGAKGRFDRRNAVARLAAPPPPNPSRV